MRKPIRAIRKTKILAWGKSLETGKRDGLHKKLSEEVCREVLKERHRHSLFQGNVIRYWIRGTWITKDPKTIKRFNFLPQKKYILEDVGSTWTKGRIEVYDAVSRNLVAIFDRKTRKWLKPGR